MDGGYLRRPREGCGARRAPRRLAVHRDLTRCLGCRGRVTAPGPDLFRTWISRPARFLMPRWRPPATTLCAARKQPSTGDQKVRKQAPEQVRLQVSTDDRDQTVGGCSYAALARAWRNGSYEGCEDLRPQCAASRASATPQPDTGGGRRGAHCTRLGSIRRPRRCQRRHGGQMGAGREATQPVLPAPLRAAVRRVCRAAGLPARWAQRLDGRGRTPGARRWRRRRAPAVARFCDTWPGPPPRACHSHPSAG